MIIENISALIGEIGERIALFNPNYILIRMYI